MRHIILVEDDDKLASLVSAFLTQHSFKVTIINNGKYAAQTIIEQQPDLVLLDIMLPETDGYTIFRQLEGVFQQPVLFLTAKDSPIEHVMGLEMGADDYIIKPVDPHVLLARINRMLRKSEYSQVRNSNTNLRRFDQLEINKSARSVVLFGQGIELTSHEFELLWLLSDTPGEPLHRDIIHKKMIGREYDGLDRTVDVRMSRLRKKLNDDTKKPYRLVTVWGKGYMLCPDAWSAEEKPN
jgi:DNA-binding response OmpR family regulator